MILLLPASITELGENVVELSVVEPVKVLLPATVCAVVRSTNAPVPPIAMEPNPLAP